MKKESEEFARVAEKLCNKVNLSAEREEPTSKNTQESCVYVNEKLLNVNERGHIYINIYILTSF